MGRRVVITGLGALSPNGIGVEAYWDGLFAGRSGVKRLTLVDPGQHQHDCGGEITDFAAEAFLPDVPVDFLGRGAQFSLVAAQMALHDSGLDLEAFPTDRFAIYAGAGTPLMDKFEPAVVEVWEAPGFVDMNPMALASCIPHLHAISAHQTFGYCAGHGVTISTACTSGALAMGLAADGIREGRFDAALCGAAEATFSRAIFNGLESSGIMYRTPREPEQIMRPFNVDRDGGVLAEGSAYAILEPLDDARARGARLYAEWLGHADLPPLAGGPQDDVTRRGLRDVMAAALEHAALRPDAVDFVSANAGSARRADAEEAQALWDVFGERTPRIPVSAIKSMIGNPTAASGPLQVAAICGCFARGMVPPVINLTELDPRCRLDVVANHARRYRSRVALTTSRSIDGSQTCTILGAPPPA